MRQLLADQAPLLERVSAAALAPDELGTLRKYLFTSWNSESLARLSSVFDPGVRRFTNQWKPIQCYYSTYFQLVAVQYVVTRKIQRAHEPTIRYATNSLVHWLPAPWCCRLDFDTATLHAFPSGTPSRGDSGWNLRNNDPFFHTACFLRRMPGTVGYASRASPAVERIPAGQPRAGRLYRRADVRVGFVSAFDVLWRFRTWANYHEADAVIEGGEYQDHAVDFDARFNEVTDTTAAVCEHILVRALGPQVLAPMYDDFLILTRGHLDTAVVARRRALLCQ